MIAYTLEDDMKTYRMTRVERDAVEVIERAGRTFGVYAEPDDAADLPWASTDTLGAVRSIRARDQKQPGERRFGDAHRGVTGWAYDFAGAVAKARVEGMSGTDAAKAAEREFDWLRRWASGGWFYAFVTVAELEEDADGDLCAVEGRDAVLGGVEWSYAMDDQVRDCVDSLISELE